MSHHEYIVIGAGPAGLQLGYFMKKAGRDHLILEGSASVGTFFRKFPRSRRLISLNRPPLLTDDPEIMHRFDWNSLLGDDDGPDFRDFDTDLWPHPDNMVAYLEAFADHHDLEVRYNTKVVSIEKRGNIFTLIDQSGETYTTPYLIIASGTKPYMPPIPGIEHVTEGYGNAPMEPESYKGQRVLIIGKGVAAFEFLNAVQETAALVVAASPEPLKLAWNTRHSGYVRSNLASPLDLYQLKLVQSILYNADVDQIEVRDGVFEVTLTFTRAEGETEVFLFDRVINCTGFCYDHAMFGEHTHPDLVIDDRLPAITNTWESTNIEGLFFMGTLSQSIDFRKAASAFVGGFRYNSRTLFALLEERKGIPLAYETLSRSPEVLARHLSIRLTRTAALFLQFGFLADVLVLEGEELRCYRELPIAYIHERFGHAPLYIVMAYDWGSYEGDVFAISRRPEAKHADESAFIHPIFRAYRRGEHAGELHLLEDLYTVYCLDGHDESYTKSRAGLPLREWHKRHHIDPLEAFLREHLQSS
ncbi:MAG: NAD(P)-binding domain-containing protein [Acidobacteriota bacterium]|nr:NAD(P)-binding domain-containing protein [Acidobacteriota bacterium]